MRKAPAPTLGGSTCLRTRSNSAAMYSAGFSGRAVADREVELVVGGVERVPAGHCIIGFPRFRGRKQLTPDAVARRRHGRRDRSNRLPWDREQETPR